MNRKEAAELLPIIQAFCEGKQIQFLFDEWKDVDEIGIREFLENPELYRIKPELKYRPFSNAEECWQEMMKHQPFGWTYDYTNNIFDCITRVTNSGIVYEEDMMSFEDVLHKFKFADCTPFGIKEEE